MWGGYVGYSFLCGVSMGEFFNFRNVELIVFNCFLVVYYVDGVVGVRYVIVYVIVV